MRETAREGGSGCIKYDPAMMQLHVKKPPPSNGKLRIDMRRARAFASSGPSGDRNGATCDNSSAENIYGLAYLGRSSGDGCTQGSRKILAKDESQLMSFKTMGICHDGAAAMDCDESRRTGGGGGG
jgi:hypothetical protein